MHLKIWRKNTPSIEALLTIISVIHKDFWASKILRKQPIRASILKQITLQMFWMTIWGKIAIIIWESLTRKSTQYYGCWEIYFFTPHFSLLLEIFLWHFWWCWKLTFIGGNWIHYRGVGKRAPLSPIWLILDN